MGDDVPVMDLQKAYSFMYYDLLSNQLEVCLVPSTTHRARNGCCSRAVVSKNPKWYRDFCKTYEYDHRKKKAKTIIKRRDILKLLKRLSEGKIVYSKYIEHLTEIAKNIQKDNTWSNEDIKYFEQYGTLPIPFTNQF